MSRERKNTETENTKRDRENSERKENVWIDIEQIRNQRENTENREREMRERD